MKTLPRISYATICDTQKGRWATSAPLVIWCCLIFILSSISGDKYPDVQWEYADKAVHLFLYLLVGAFAFLFFCTRGFNFWIPIIYGILFGLSDEIHQLFVPRRTFSLSDLATDCCGVLLGVAVMYGVKRYSFNQEFSTIHEDSSERMEAG